MKYRVNEIFTSIQGEGTYSGVKAVFVRFSGCNLKCPWCDTDHSKFTEFGTDELVTMIYNHVERELQFSNPLFRPIILTGGEPTIQPLEELLRRLKSLTAAAIHIETNGELPHVLYDLKEKELLDFITVSPKRLNFNTAASLKLADEVKVVFESEEKTRDFSNSIPYPVFHSGHAFIQPCSEDFKPAVEYVMEHSEWRLGIQMHKAMKFR